MPWFLWFQNEGEACGVQNVKSKRPERDLHDLKSDPNSLFVGMAQYAYIVHTGVIPEAVRPLLLRRIWTTGISPCTGVSMESRSAGKVFLAHLSPDYGSAQGFMKFVVTKLGSLGGSADLRVVGNALVIPKETDVYSKEIALAAKDAGLKIAEVDLGAPPSEHWESSSMKVEK